MQEFEIPEIIVSFPELKYMRDENGDLLKFPNKDHAVRYLKVNNFTDEAIAEMSFFYTNESKECNCFLCERMQGCNFRDKFQRLPRDKGGLGLCPKLK